MCSGGHAQGIPPCWVSPELPPCVEEPLSARCAHGLSSGKSARQVGLPCAHSGCSAYGAQLGCPRNGQAGLRAAEQAQLLDAAQPDGMCQADPWCQELVHDRPALSDTHTQRVRRARRAYTQPASTDKRTQRMCRAQQGAVSRGRGGLAACTVWGRAFPPCRQAGHGRGAARRSTHATHAGVQLGMHGITLSSRRRPGHGGEGPGNIADHVRRHAHGLQRVGLPLAAEGECVFKQSVCRVPIVGETVPSGTALAATLPEDIELMHFGTSLRGGWSRPCPAGGVCSNCQPPPLPQQRCPPSAMSNKTSS